MRDRKSKIIYLIVCILAFLIGLFCTGCALKITDVVVEHPDGTKETDKSFHLGTPDFSTGKEINAVKIM